MPGQWFHPPQFLPGVYLTPWSQTNIPPLPTVWPQVKPQGGNLKWSPLPELWAVIQRHSSARAPTSVGRTLVDLGQLPWCWKLGKKLQSSCLRGGPRQGLVGGHGAGTTSEIVLKLSYVLYFIVYFGLYKFLLYLDTCVYHKYTCIILYKLVPIVVLQQKRHIN